MAHITAFYLMEVRRVVPAEVPVTLLDRHELISILGLVRHGTDDRVAVQ